MKSLIYVVSGPGQGHLSPCLELCKHLSSRNHHTKLMISSSVLSSVPDLTKFPLIEIAPISATSGPPMMSGSEQAISDLENHLSSSSDFRILCAIIDFQVGWSKEVFWKFNVPVIGFFTFGACAAAMEWALWEAQVLNLKPGDIRFLNGLPDEMAVSFAEVQRRPIDPPPGKRIASTAGGGRGGGPPKPGDRPPWVMAIEGSVALMFNTSDDLERRFLDYMADRTGMPSWGVGPLLPEQYWNSFGSIIRNPNPNTQSIRVSNYTEDEVIQWLDVKPRGAVLYVAFGSEVCPTIKEYHQLADTLEESTRPFIWAIQSKSGGPDPEETYFPHGLDDRVGARGLIIHGWAPQLLILSHPSTGGFLSHCGWNSTVESICQGVPIVAWPIRGDQFYNAKLVVDYLKIGYTATSGDASEMVKKDDILKGIEKLMGDDEVKTRAIAIRDKFKDGFPNSSNVALDKFCDFISEKTS